MSLIEHITTLEVAIFTNKEYLRFLLLLLIDRWNIDDFAPVINHTCKSISLH